MGNFFKDLGKVASFGMDPAGTLVRKASGTDPSNLRSWIDPSGKILMGDQARAPSSYNPPPRRPLSPGAQKLYDNILARRAERAAQQPQPMQPQGTSMADVMGRRAKGLFAQAMQKYLERKGVAPPSDQNSAPPPGFAGGMAPLAANVSNQIAARQPAAPPVQIPTRPAELTPLSYADGGKVVKDHCAPSRRRR